ncbi:hypothetical protein S7711_09263 [Stachybotrys chartarum IBT 7711]|uniref:Heterokaryon incompatibility domain-containing protein n=1 Tax=Stachybotrys chartarum (strain CBS 109288 / IBT 7711) TaxID=1280523 RepID=A0A084ALQ8_STACB|nr:hypothetical protein S7711_09263 [Stachybotrys chartarum IBT 7711]
MCSNLDQVRNQENRFTHPSIDPSRQLRLVVLEPAQRQGRYAFNFRIVSFADLDGIAFNALSYRWGTANSSEDIELVWVGDQQLWIRRQLFEFTQDALAWSRAGDESGLQFNCSLPIFIDAICINQLDPIEKASQVPKMADIYRSADQVITYLGKPYCSDESMQRQIHGMLRTLNSKLTNGPRATVSGGPTTMSSSDVAQIFSLTSWTHDDLFAFGILCRDMYWTRMWIVPEVLLAPRRWTVVCGRQAFEGHLLAGYLPSLVSREVEAQGVVERGMPLLGPEASIAARQAENDLNRAIDMLQGQEGRNLLKLRYSVEISRRPDLVAGDLAGFSSTATEDGLSFYHAFDAFGQQDCYDKRDKVYALLPLLKRRTQAQIKVSYTLSAWHAFETALRLGWQDLQRDRLWECVTDGHNIGMMYSGYCGVLLERFRVTASGRAGARRIVRRLAWELDLRGNWRSCQTAFSGGTNSMEEVNACLMLLEWGYFGAEMGVILQRAIDNQLPESSVVYRCLAVRSEREVWSRG